VTSQPGANPAEGRPAGSITNPLRELVAFVLLGADALLLLVALINLLVPYGRGSGFTDRAGGSFFDFVSVLPTALPLLAVLLSTHIAPTVSRARLITQVALVEYAVSAVFGAIAALAWLVGTLADGELRSAFTGLLLRVAYAGVFGCAAFVVYKIWRTLYYVPRPKAPAPQPGLYGQPSQPPQGYNQASQGYGQPGPGYPGYPPAQGYPQAPGYPPAYSPAPAYPGYQPQPQQPGYPPAGGYEQPDAQPPAAQTPAPPPMPGPPAPSGAQPSSSPPADTDRTQVIDPGSEQPPAGTAPPHRPDDEDPTRPGR
jgi:hypothetical protein